MRILHTVQFYPPSVGGAQEVVRQLSERLAARGHEVTVATTRLPERDFAELNGVKIVEFALSGNHVLGYKGDTASYQRFLTEGKFDVMMNYAARQWAADLVFPVLDAISYAKVFIPCGFMALKRPKYWSYFRKMPAVLRRYDHLVFHAQDFLDINFARKHGLRNLTVIPNGAAADEFLLPHEGFRARNGIREEMAMLLTVGSHTGQKGHRLSIEAFGRAAIGPAVLVVIGNTLGHPGCLPEDLVLARRVEEQSGGVKRVLILDPPREETLAAFEAADLFLFCSNVEYSPLVLYEAIASRTPFLSLDVGNAREIAVWTGGGAILPTERKWRGYVNGRPDAVARELERMWRDVVLRYRMAEEGYAAWCERFTWEYLTLRYEELYMKLVEG